MNVYNTSGTIPNYPDKNTRLAVGAIILPPE
jgi:hypothetical protein